MLVRKVHNEADSNAVVGEVSPTFIYLQESLFSSMSTPQVPASVPRKRSWRFVSSFESFWVERILRQSLHLKAENLMQKVVSVASLDLSLSASVQTGENQLSDALGISLKVLGGV